MKPTATVVTLLAALAGGQARAEGFYQHIYGERPASGPVAATPAGSTTYPAIYEQVMRSAAAIAATEVRRPAAITPADYPAIYRRLMDG